MNAFSPVREIVTPQRLRFSVADVDLLVERGVLPENARVELIDGDLIQMASEGGPHIRFKVELNRFLARNLDDAWRVAPDATLRLDEFSAPEPDLYVYLAALQEEEIRGPDVALLIELSATTQAFDLQRKAALYAGHQVAEYWVIDIPGGRVHLHTEPALGGYLHVERRTFDDLLECRRLGIRFRLNDLERIRRG